MSKRFFDSSLWDRDWFLELDSRSQLFCLYLREKCDHAGIWSPSFKRFEQTTGVRINPNDYISMCNKDGATRILILPNGRWWITGFIEDQNNGCKILNTANKYYLGVFRQLENNQVPYLSFGYKIAPTKGIEAPTKGHKEEDKERGIDINSSLKKEEMQEGKNTSLKLPTWRDSFEIYMKECGEAFDKLAYDMDWIEQKKRYYPYTSIRKSLEKMINEYWGTEAGWIKKKSNKKLININWVRTIENGLSMACNQVRIAKGQQDFEQEEIEVRKHAKPTAI